MGTVEVDFAAPAGTIKALHGVNNGPINFGAMLVNRHRYRELGVPWVRLHDPNWPHPREVDVPQKTFYAFKAFRELLSYPARAAATCDIPGVDVLAARSADRRSGALLIANFGAHEGRASIGVNGLARSDAPPEVMLVDRDHSLEPMTALAASANAFVAGQAHLRQNPAPGESSANVIELWLRRHSVCLLRVGSGKGAPD